MTFFSWQMAEELAAEHMRRSGFSDARRTPAGTDAGVDVLSSRAVAQVKYQVTPVGGPVVQQLRGAAHGVDHALFYASNGYTAAALTAAERSEVALFTFTTTNDVIPVNAEARAILNRRPETGDEDLVAEFRATRSRFYAWSDAIKELTADGPSEARAALGEERLIEIADGIEAAFKALGRMRACFDRLVPTEERSKIRAAIAASNAATDEFAAVIAALPEPYASRFGTLYTEHYLEAVGTDDRGVA